MVVSVVATPTRHWPVLAAVSRSAWHRLGVPPQELRLDTTLENGQCFGWQRQPGSDPVWVGVLGEHILALMQADDDCMYRCVGGPAATAGDATVAAAAQEAVEQQLRAYFQLDEPLGPLYSQWAAADERMASVARAVPGMRVLRQEPVECLFSFICSSNNNIARIGGMVQSLRERYGERIAPSVGAFETPPPPAEEAAAAAAAGEHSHFAFPTVGALAAASDDDLRRLGMGYRADYVRRSAQIVQQRGPEWLLGMRCAERDAVRTSLCELPGVGPKVADCAALFCLDQADIVPVDTHVWQIACRDLDPTLRECKSLTPAVYERVGSLFRARYGAHCGWAHSLLFAAELPQFSKLLPTEVQREMAAFKADEKELKKEAAQKRKERREAKAATVAEGDGEEQEGEADGDDAPAAPKRAPWLVESEGKTPSKKQRNKAAADPASTQAPRRKSKSRVVD